MITKVSDIIVPQIFIAAIAEKSVRDLRLLKSGVAVKTTEYDQIASGLGTSANLNYFGPASVDDEAQVEDTDVTISKVAGKTQVVPILNRQFSLGSTALAQFLGTLDPVGYITSQISQIRSENRENTMIAIMQGVIASTAFAPIVTDLTNPTGTGASLSLDGIIQATGKVGVLRGKFQNGGVLFIHPDVETSLLLADLIDTAKDSAGVTSFNTFAGLKVITSDAPGMKTAVAGVEGKYVYTSIIFAPGAIAYGEKPQTTGIDLASLNYVEDIDKNNYKIVDRTRFLIAPSGASWKSTNAAPAGSSYTNAELKAGAWDLVVDYRNLPYVAVKTNG